MSENRFVQMQQIIGDLAYEYDVPFIDFDDFVELGKRVVKVYNLESQAKSIPFSILCEYINCFVKTPFGEKAIKDIAINVCV